MKSIKYTIKLGLILPLILNLSSCNKDESTNSFLKCDAPEEIIFNADGTSKHSIVFVESNCDWNVTLSPNEWLEITDISENSFTLTATKNETTSQRDEVSITISAKGVNDIIIIAKQLPGNYNLTISPDLDSIHFNANGEIIAENGELLEELTFKVTTDLKSWDLSLSNQESWLKHSIDIENSSFTLRADRNNNMAEPEKITVSLKYENETIRTIIATQDGYDTNAPLTDIYINNIPDGTAFTITYINNLSIKDKTDNGKIVTRGLSGDISTIYSISSEITGDIIIGRQQDETITLAFDDNGKLEYRKDSNGKILINTVAELMRINEDSNNLSGKYLQESNLHLLGDESMIGQPYAKRINWIPIGSNSSEFTGEYDGNGYSIGNIFSQNKDYVGIFGYTGKTAVLENINVSSGMLETESYAGFICGHNQGKIINCTSSSTNTQLCRFGGICGHNGENGEISKCENKSKIIGYNTIGGICSQNNGLINECVNSGKIEITEVSQSGAIYSETIGGICGRNDGTILNCTNNAEVSDSSNSVTKTGGICGLNITKIEGCINSGYVKGFSDIGGIAGASQGLYEKATISKCINTGKIEAVYSKQSLSNPVGGIIGTSISVNIYGCINQGEIIGHLEAGGISGYFYRGTIYSCYNIANITGNKSIGGVVGYIATDKEPRTKLYSCYNTGEVTAYKDNYKGGVCGENYGDIIDCFYLGYDGIEGVGHSREETRTYKFSEEQWPSSATDGWGTGNGTEYNTYWKTLGKYVSGGTPDGVSSEFPKLWWEE